jgi:hypothetical protein
MQGRRHPVFKKSSLWFFDLLLGRKGSKSFSELYSRKQLFDWKHFAATACPHLAPARAAADLVLTGLKQAGGIAPSITLPDWTIENWNTKLLGYALAPGFEYSGYAFEFTATRNVQNYILKVIFPLVLIVMMSWAGFWIDPVNANSQISVAVTSMLTLIAYRFTVDTQLPRLPYMTRLDVFFLVSTLLVFFSLVEVLVTTILDNNQQTARAKKIDRYCRVIFPVIFAITLIAIFVHPGG